MSQQLPILGNASLCQLGQQSCGACCWGNQLKREDLAPVLERNRLLFAELATSHGPPRPWRLFWHEIVSRRGLNLLWAPSLLIPGVGHRLKQWLAKRMVCAFVAFTSPDQSQVGCLLHPLRFDGIDCRQANAFRLLKGVHCGSTSYICDGCRRYNHETPEWKQDFGRFTSPLDWFHYSIVVQASGAEIPLPFESQPRSSE